MKRRRGKRKRGGQNVVSFLLEKRETLDDSCHLQFVGGLVVCWIFLCCLLLVERFKDLIPSILLTKVDLAKTIMGALSGALLTMSTFTFSTILVVITMYSSQFLLRIGSLLGKIGAVQTGIFNLADEKGKARIKYCFPTYHSILYKVYFQLSHYGKEDISVMYSTVDSLRIAANIVPQHHHETI